ncbi:MAG: TlpA disulfide reductase family protein [Tepidisphaeraceae bacterium]|jgi:peroxiredoxin
MRFIPLFIVLGIAGSLDAAEIRLKTSTTRPAMLIQGSTRPASRPAAAMAEVSPEVQAVLERVTAAYGAVKSLELGGTVRMQLNEDGQERVREAGFTGKFLTPGFFRHETKDEPLVIGTGKKAYLYVERERVFEQSDVPEGRAVFEKLTDSQKQILLLQDPGLALALSDNAGQMLRRLVKKVEAGGEAKAGGVDCVVLKVQLSDPDSPAELKFEKATQLLREMTVDMTASVQKEGRPDIRDVRYAVSYGTIKTDTEVKAEAFAFAVPAGTREMSEMAAADDEGDGGDKSPLPGQAAPDFALEDLEGNTVKLADLKGSVVILDFWATWCGPCRAAMPHLNVIYEKHKAAGLKVFIVNQQEEKDKVARFIEANKLTMPALLDLKAIVGKKYHVNGIPTTVVIGRDGVVKQVHVGFGGSLDDLDRELEAMLK